MAAVNARFLIPFCILWFFFYSYFLFLTMMMILITLKIIQPTNTQEKDAGFNKVIKAIDEVLAKGFGGLIMGVGYSNTPVDNSTPCY
jgi:uncharacterized membrane-anchored protein YitT (DUF2179 family)